MSRSIEISGGGAWALAITNRAWAIAARVAHADGWLRAGIGFACGALSVLALAPFFLFPVLLLTLPVLVWLIDGCADCERRTAGPGSGWRQHPVLRAGIVGWWFGFGYFVLGLFWIGEAFFVEAERFLWALPLAVIGLPAGLALFFAGAAAAARLCWDAGLLRIAVLALALAVLEWLRGHIFTGFPWNVLGYALTWPLPLMQGASVIGIYGLTFWTVVIAAGPAVALADRGSSTTPSRRLSIAVLIAVLPLTALWGFGTWRLARADHAVIPDVRLRLVQPSVPQREKWHPEHQRRIFFDHLALSRQQPDGTGDTLDGITHVIWPEAAMPFVPLASPEALRLIGEMLGDGPILIAGGLRVEQTDGLTPRRVFNSLMVFTRGGSAVATYDKNHLVPFGEYLPFHRTLEAIGLEALTRMRGGFTAGPAPRPVLSIPGLPGISPLICYEAIFPAAIVQTRERPRLLINLTNDGWFGNTTGPPQHFHQARVRAVEEGLGLIRVANNGISAAIDPFGKVMARLELNQRGVIDTAAPGPIVAPIYARLGDMLFLLQCLIVVVWIGHRSVRRGKTA